MNLLVTLLSPSASLSGFMANAYKTESQLNRFKALREKNGVLTATESALDAAQHYFEAQAAGALSQLDNMELCDKPPTVPTFKATLEELGVGRNSPGKSEFWRVVESVAKASAVRRWDTRLQIEAYEATQRGWLLVFDTITYDPSQYSDEVMFGKYWRRYQRSVQHAVVRRALGSVRKFRASGKSFSDFVRYFAVPESHKDGRTHVHVLWFVSDLPDTCALADPNAHMPPTPRRQVDGWPTYPYGMITMRLPVRYKGDAFSSRLGWRLPLDKDGKRPILKDSIAVARYMAKYLSKPKPETLKCRRIRTSPRLGLLSIQAKLSTLTNPSAVPPVSGPPAGSDPAGDIRHPDTHFVAPQPSAPPDGAPVSPVPEPPPWTDEDYIRYAQERFGGKFSGPAARAFHDFDPSSSAVQAAEFFRFRDEQLELFGYF